jgi:hypothetical protein
MTYASTSVDRRAEYYARSAAVIAADPLDFYTRAERGRRFQASRLTLRSPQPQSSAVVHYLSDARREAFAPLPMDSTLLLPFRRSATAP